MEFIRPLEDQYVYDIPGTATFECELSKDNISVAWQRAGQPISAGDKYEMVSEVRVHKLIIKNVTGEDMAEFTAVARGKTSTANLIVEGEHLFY